jgi:hypothetical protein
MGLLVLNPRATTLIVKMYVEVSQLKILVVYVMEMVYCVKMVTILAHQIVLETTTRRTPPAQTLRKIVRVHVMEGKFLILVAFAVVMAVHADPNFALCSTKNVTAKVFAVGIMCWMCARFVVAMVKHVWVAPKIVPVYAMVPPPKIPVAFVVGLEILVILLHARMAMFGTVVECVEVVRLMMCVGFVEAMVLVVKDA